MFNVTVRQNQSQDVIYMFFAYLPEVLKIIYKTNIIKCLKHYFSQLILKYSVSSTGESTVSNLELVLSPFLIPKP